MASDLLGQHCAGVQSYSIVMESLFESIVCKLLPRLPAASNSYSALLCNSTDTDGGCKEGGGCQYASNSP